MHAIRSVAASAALAAFAGCATGETLEESGASSVDAGLVSTGGSAGGVDQGGAPSDASTSYGGASAGGRAASNGGVTSTGGATTKGSGGASGAAGAASSGGKTGSGGAGAAGGAMSSGGGAGTGGATSSGGSASSGGKTGSGGGTSAGGSTGSGGATGAGGTGGCPADSLTSSTTGCPGQLLTLAGSPPTATATGSMNNGSGSFNSVDCGQAAGVENIFRFVAPMDGTVDVLLQHGGYNASFYVRAACDGGPATLACSDSGQQNTTETISFAAKACQTYYVFSDKRSNCCSTGSYTLTLRYQ